MSSYAASTRKGYTHPACTSYSSCSTHAYSVPSNRYLRMYDETEYDPEPYATLPPIHHAYRISNSLDTGPTSMGKEIDTRRVHFDLPKKRNASRYNETYMGRSQRTAVFNGPSRSNNAIRQQDMSYAPRSSLQKTLSPLPRQARTNSQPTIYILTYSLALHPTTPSLLSLLASQLPARTPPIRHLYTIDATTITPPSARLAVRRAVDELLVCGLRGETEVAMSVCCRAGTHRSVAIAERIAQEVRE